MIGTLGKTLACAAGLLVALATAAQAANVDKALHDALPANYQSKGVAVAAFNDWPPDEFVENGELKGWSIDMAKAMSERLGVPFSFEATSFDVIIPGLASKRYDAGFSSFGVTPERLEVLDFVPQRKEGTGYAFLKGKPLTLKEEKDLCGHSVALLTGAWDLQYLTKVSAELCADKPIDLQQFTTQNAAELAVSSGRVEIVAAGSAKLAYLAKQTGKFEMAGFISNAVFNGIGVRKGDALGPALKGALQAMIDDGSYKAIMAKWGVDGAGMLDKAVLITKDNPNP
ncbi:ABC transporter substrate-binding protein [Xaviernesmea oryzae]|uniref:ABC transporter substrate-binding protein n=1 Tax=Xaviernesmea oryzae TaxID=464029 RepID=A0A1Q9AWM3_9HYPH|nr:ABC transporter substrate-binding protein [Xaviernesmea oryzae]OLP59863.1 ABC transporter substrate-binding protein [Xaviernesmea oryzae]SEK48282.1 polar amino acid transport system substrate-binding protein [Xaviernesmea oryzae]